MGFHDVRFPTGVSYGSTGGPAFDVDLSTIAAGHQEAVLRSPDAPRVFNARYTVRTLQDIRDVLTFFLAREGATHTFRYLDWIDYSSAADHVGTPASTDQVLGVGDGTTKQFQLRKTYTSGGHSHTRTITKPQSGTVVVSLDDVAQGSGWSVDTSTGIVTFTTAPDAAEVVKAGFLFDCEVRFGASAGSELAGSIDRFQDGSIPDIELMEELGSVSVFGFENYGGAIDRGAITADQLLVPVQGRVQLFAPAVSGLALILPATSLRLPLGGVYFWLIDDGSEDLDIQNADGSSLHTLGAGDMAAVAITAVGDGDPVWIAWAI